MIEMGNGALGNSMEICGKHGRFGPWQATINETRNDSPASRSKEKLCTRSYAPTT